jgi:4-hydroxybenzoyl-CoA thioesterase
MDASATTPVPSAVFSQRHTVRFSHCDPAGIVFFPQYFVLLNGVVEDWFTQGLGVDYATLIGERRVGLPTVSLQCDFVAPSRMGEQITFNLSVARIGRRSINLDITCAGPDGDDDTRLRMRMRQVLVTTSLATHQSMDIPPDVRSALARWNATQDTTTNMTATGATPS